MYFTFIILKLDGNVPSMINFKHYFNDLFFVRMLLLPAVVVCDQQ